MKRILGTLLFLPLFLAVQAQKDAPLHVSYALSQEGMAGMEALLFNNAKVDVYMSKGQKRLSALMGGGLLQTDSYAGEGRQPVSLMRMMARKVKVLGMDAPKAASGASKIQYDKKDRKKIQGYLCHKASIKSADGTVVTLYVCEDIRMRMEDMLPGDWGTLSGLKGFPLEMSSEGKGGKVTLTAKSISDKVPDSIFQYDDTGYEETTWKELGGMF